MSLRRPPLRYSRPTRMFDGDCGRQYTLNNKGSIWRKPYLIDHGACRVPVKPARLRPLSVRNPSAA